MLRKVNYGHLRTDAFSIEQLQIIAELTGIPIQKGWKPDEYWMPIETFIDGSEEHLYFISALQRARMKVEPTKWTEWEHSDLIQAEFLTMVIQEVIEDQVTRDEMIHWHGYDYSEMCQTCLSGVKQKDVLCLDKQIFSTMAHDFVVALADHWQKVAHEPFHNMIERAGLTGINFLPTRDYLERDAHFPPMWQIEVTGRMPPALMNDDMIKCLECGRTRSTLQIIRYSRKSLATIELCDFNLANEWPMSPISPELQGRSIIVKNSVYKLCYENGIGTDQIAWDVVKLE